MTGPITAEDVRDSHVASSGGGTRISFQLAADFLNARLAARTPDAATVERLTAALHNIRALAVKCSDMTGDGNWDNVEGFANAGIRALAALSSATSAKGE